ncbi:Oligopeptide transporter subunit ATP-binding component of ABC superfamily (Modular protein) [Frankia sp. Hr75.2]|nr:Oligopeptide transporter subunit ATP-binding component of ABC superfamily (Modular protein) [Frankia sp. Hr75.2]
MSTLLDVEDLVVDYPVRGFRKSPVRALRGVSVDVRPGECLGIVGESGSGKTTLSRAVLGLAPVTSGSIRLKGQDIVRLSRGRRQRLADKIQAVLHDPYSSLDPALTVETSLAEPLRAQRVPVAAAARRVRELLDQVGLPASAGRRLPREFSGGQRQCLAVARAMALSPELIICDDPVSALDPPSQWAVLDLLVELQNTTGVAYVFISHDLAVVRHASHRVAVLEHGEVVKRIDGDRVAGAWHRCPQRQFPAAPVPDTRLRAECRASQPQSLQRPGRDDSLPQVRRLGESNALPLPAWGDADGRRLRGPHGERGRWFAGRGGGNPGRPPRESPRRHGRRPSRASGTGPARPIPQRSWSWRGDRPTCYRRRRRS